MKTALIKYLPASIFLGLLFTDVTALVIGLSNLHFWVKPLLIPFLLMWLLQNRNRQHKSNWIYIAVGLFFAWLGDVFLLFDDRNPIFFLLGLGFFLGTHLCYILFFRKLMGQFPAWRKVGSWVILAILSYGILLVIVLWNNLGTMKIPVMVYAGCISIMVMLSILIQPSLPKPIWIWFALGAFLFLISDSILAINKFYAPQKLGPPAVMLTYGLAQFFITFGSIRYARTIMHAGKAPAG